MRVRVLRRADYRRMRWKNGGGWTTQLATFPEKSAPEVSADANAPFDWRISIAEIESDGAFSAFPGCDRHIALLEGIGMELRFDGAETQRLELRLRFVPFAGEVPVFGKLLAGPVRDFNVMTRRDRCRAEILHRPLVGPMLFVPDTATWFVYLVDGRAECGIGDATSALGAGDSLLLEPDRAGGNVVLRGGGEVVLVKLTCAAADCG
jgi:environmental stress-induced protein Ves